MKWYVFNEQALLTAFQGTMLGAFCVGVIGDVYSVLSYHPGIVVSAVGIAILLPGSIIIRSLNAFVRNDTIRAINFLFRMFTIGVSAVVGMFASYFVGVSKRLSW
jgi:uncharacterized membrane protein YjjB (DUF3815 family)